MFSFVRSMAFWQWTSALSYWNSCSLSSWNAHLEVRDCFPSPHYAAPPVSDSAWVVCPLACIHTHLLACKCIKGNLMVVWECRGFPTHLLSWPEYKAAPWTFLFLLVWGRVFVSLCVLCYWEKTRHTTQCKAARRMRSLQTQVVLQVLLRMRVHVIGRMSIYRFMFTSWTPLLLKMCMHTEPTRVYMKKISSPKASSFLPWFTQTKF